ncbi:hypothetical protein ACQZV8_08620 [Magnetococcales bacterium HHB-1]
MVNPYQKRTTKKWAHSTKNTTQVIVISYGRYVGQAKDFLEEMKNTKIHKDIHILKRNGKHVIFYALGNIQSIDEKRIKELKSTLQKESITWNKYYREYKHVVEEGDEFRYLFPSFLGFSYNYDKDLEKKILEINKSRNFGKNKQLNNLNTLSIGLTIYIPNLLFRSTLHALLKDEKKYLTIEYATKASQ